MVDTYTKVMLTVIAVALVWLGIQPMIRPTAVSARDRIEVEGTVGIHAAYVQPYGPLQVECISGCK